MNKEKALKNQGLEFREDMLSNRGAQIIWKQSITYQKVLENRGLFKHSRECDKIGNCHIPFLMGGIETE